MRVARMFALPLVLVLTSPVWGSGPSSAGGPQTLTGEIMDTICAGYKGHARMMQQMKSMGSDKKTCIQKCLQLGGKYALDNAANGTVYTIANPEKVRAFDGQEVEVTGSLEKKKLTVTEIKPTGTGAEAARISH